MVSDIMIPALPQGVISRLSMVSREDMSLSVVSAVAIACVSAALRLDGLTRIFSSKDFVHNYSTCSIAVDSVIVWDLEARLAVCNAQPPSTGSAGREEKSNIRRSCRLILFLAQ
ncbi:unnamed protein product [Periconia digitata]|uniref:Uncharacterized protein n=1 Tax=Periconia digitata TaxID=1303443 RepID=A0A9W4UTB0_9PLEO|nr:unnamed protein product [Periconia digitata]